MTAFPELDAALEQYHRAASDFIKGDCEPYKAIFSQREDVTLANPFGPPVRGWPDAEATMERAASFYRDGEVVRFDNVATYATPELAYIVEVERYRARMGGSQTLADVTLRTTSILRPEDGTWRVVHRHADPIASPRPATSVVEA